MSTGAKILKRALQNIGAHSELMPASPESIEVAKDTLNGMIARWEDNNIKMGCVPLEVEGSELSEPLGAMNGVIFNLALELHPQFPGSQISPELRANAFKTYNEIVRRWKIVEIPKPIARGTLPLGQGNKSFGTGSFSQTYFEKDQEIG